MKKTLFFLIAVALFSTKVMAQSAEVVIFSEDGERFWVVIEGVLQNEEPQPRVKIEGLTKDYYRVKIIFEIEEIPDINKNITTRDVDDNLINTSYRIFKRKKGYAMWPHSFEEVDTSQPAEETITLQTEGPTKPKPPTEQKPSEPIAEHTEVVSTQSITITMPDGTTVTFAPGTVIDSQYVEYIEEDYHEIVMPVEEETKPIYTEPEPEPDPVYSLPGYNGPVGCSWPMDDSAFNRAKNSIENQSFESDMLTVAKQVASNNCLLVNQVIEIIELFGFEDSRLDFAKYAYDYTYDIGNYYQVNDAFSFSSSTNELNDYINRRK